MDNLLYIIISQIMKKLIILTFLLSFPLIGMETANETVYICTGPKAVVYHKTKDCRGLSKCSDDVVSVSLEKISKTSRPCKICY